MNQSPTSLSTSSRSTAENLRRLFSRATLIAFLGFPVLSPPTAGAATREFVSSGGITINDSADASPYPSTINVSGVSGAVTAVRVKLNGFSHTFPDDVDIFLVAPDGKIAAVMSDAGGGTGVSGLNLVFDDAAATVIPDGGAILSGSYRPADYDAVETLPSGAVGPVGDNLTALASAGTNGAWKLYVRDDFSGDTGEITSWALEFVSPGSLTATFSSATDIPLTSAAPAVAGDTVNLALNFAPAVGTNLTVLKNTGRAFTGGQFSNLPNGAAVNLTFGSTTYPFVAWYYGGDGNDLVLLWASTGLASWGRNANGQLGDNSQTQRNAPVAVDQSGVLLGKTIVQVARSEFHSLALCSDGTVAAWGLNTNGQLGDTTTTQRLVPVAVNAANGVSALFGKTVVAVAAGGNHSLALCSDGTVAAWGANTYGQLGDTTTTQRLAPVAVNVANGTSALFGKSVVSVSAGARHSLVLCADGAVVTWGWNFFGAIGDNTTTDRPAPTAVNTANGTSALFGKSVIAVKAGNYHNLALSSDGLVSAWGWNNYGGLGDNTLVTRLVPVTVNTSNGVSALFGKTVVAIAAGGWHSLAMSSDGTLAAWGNNTSGELGDTTTTGRVAPVTVNVANGVSSLFGKTVVAIAAGGNHNLALTSDGRLSAWGENYYGALGDNTLTSRSAPVLVNVANGVSVLNGKVVNGLSLGSSTDHSAAIYGGSSFPATLSSPSTIPVTSSGYTASGPAILTLQFAPTQGRNLTLVKNTGPAFINGQFSNLPNGATVNLSFGGTTYPFVAWYYGGDGNDLELLWPYTALASWGTNTNGQLGDGTTSDRITPVAVDVDAGGVLVGKTIVQVARGASHSLALCSDGTVAAWGLNTNGQLGDNTTTQRLVPVAVNAANGVSALFGKTVVAVAAGASHSLALFSDGTLAAWGLNTNGQLGDNSLTQHLVPVTVNAANGVSSLYNKTVVRIAAGVSHSLAQSSDGSLAAWGRNNYGQLGDNGTTDRLVPVAVNTTNGTSSLFGKTVVGIAAGLYHSLAVSSDGTVAAWGRNSSFQLGDNTPTNRSAPVAVNTTNGTSALFGKTVIGVAAGGEHSLAVSSDGTVAAWGRGTVGELGNDTLTYSGVPVAVTTSGILSGKTVTAVAAGYEQSLALCSDGTAAAWGQRTGKNDPGNNYFDDSANVPVAVSTASTASGSSALAGKPVTRLSPSPFGLHSLVVAGAAAPEIEVEVLEPSLTSLTDNVGIVNFGSVVAAGRTFRVRNTGGLPLRSVSASLTGPDAASFAFVKLPGSTLAESGGTTDLIVSFSATSPGVKNATLQITSTDPNENPFRIALTGTKLAALPATFAAATDVPLTSLAVSLGNTTVNLTLAYAPTPGTNLTVIKNTGASPISGQFSNLANGATVNLSFGGTTYPFVAWYYGGVSNNDLVLLWPYTGLAGWGRNVDGQLGDNSRDPRNAPVAVDQTGVLAGKTIVQVARGGLHSLALCSDGTVASWGRNTNGQLGDNTTIFRTVPVAVNTANGVSALFGKSVIAIAAGATHSLAVCSDGTVAAWGFNGFGQLGDNSTTQRFVPFAVSVANGVSALFGKTVVAVAAGLRHSLALCSDGTVATWGYNDRGQLGDNTGTQRNAPVAVYSQAGSGGGNVGIALAGRTVISVAAGGDHNLALCSDGTLVAWGDGTYGQAGFNGAFGAPGAYRFPVAVNTANGTSALFGKTVVAIAAGDRHSLALCSDGTVAAWGTNTYGQLGDTTTTQRLAPVAVNTTNGTSALFGKTVVAIAAGGDHTFASCSDGSVVAWGDNGKGQLGDNTTTQRLVPTAVHVASGTSALAGRSVTGLSSGAQGQHSLAVFAASAPRIEVEVLEAAPASLTDNVGTVNYGTSLAAGRTFRVRNPTGLPLLGLSASLTGTGAAAFTVITPPATELADATSTDIVVAFNAATPGAYDATLLIAKSATDANPFRIALTATKQSTLTATFASAGDIPVIAPASNLTGNSVTLALGFAPIRGTNLTLIRNTGHRFISGEFSNLANGSTVNLSFGGTTYAFVAWYYGGDGNDLELLWPGAKLAGWGHNSNGQIGDNTSSNQRNAAVAVEQSGVLAGKTIVQVARAEYHSLALCSDGTVAAWGIGGSGQLGDNTSTSRTAPVAVNVANGVSALFGKTVVAIAAGSEHSLALCSDGTVAAWGLNTSGQLGDNSTDNRAVPVAVNVAGGTSALAGKSVVALSAGASHTLALCSDGTVAAWGNNFSGPLGDSTTTARNAPVAVNVAKGTSFLFGKTVVAISAGGGHSLALCSDGTLAAWGYNFYGQLGDTTSTNRSAPVAVNRVSGTSSLFGRTVTAIAAGGLHNLALCSDGTIAVWGHNIQGQLGDGNGGSGPTGVVRQWFPVLVNTENGTSALFGKSVVAVSTGDRYSLALCSDGTVATWGQNINGQLGDNSTNDALVPVAVNTTAGTSVLAGKRVNRLPVSSASARHSLALAESVTRAMQTIDFTSIGDLFFSESSSLSASGGASGQPVVFAVVSGPAVINAGVLSFTGGGSVTISASQAGDGDNDDAIVTRTFNVVAPRPDVAVGASAAALVGAGIYTPTGQLVSLTSKKANAVTGYAGISNRAALPDDRAADVLAVQGTPGNALFQVSYFGPEGNVTAGLVSGTYRTAAIDGDDAPISIRAVVVPNKKKLVKKKGGKAKILKKSFSTLLRVGSTASPAVSDSAAISVGVR